MAALRPCLSAPPVPSSTLRLAPRSNALRLRQLVGRRSTVKPISLRVRARSGAADNQPAPKPELPDEFCEEQDKIDEYCEKISNASFLEFAEEQGKIEEYYAKISCDNFLHLEATALCRYLFTIAKKSVRLASIVMECVVLSPAGTADTYEKEMLHTHVRAIASAAEDVYHKKVTRRSSASFIDALDGVAQISYVVAQVTRWSLLCARDSDADRAQAEYQRKMGNLKVTLVTAEPYEAYKILKSTMADALSLTQSRVILMSVDHKHSLLGLNPGLPDDYGFASENHS